MRELLYRPCASQNSGSLRFSMICSTKNKCTRLETHQCMKIYSPFFYLKPNCSNYMFDICLMMVVSSRFINYFPVFPLSCSVWNASGLWHETFRLTLLGIFFFKHLNLKHIRVQHHIRKESIRAYRQLYIWYHLEQGKWVIGPCLYCISFISIKFRLTQI